MKTFLNIKSDMMITVDDINKFIHHVYPSNEDLNEMYRNVEENSKIIVIDSLASFGKSPCLKDIGCTGLIPGQIFNPRIGNNWNDKIFPVNKTILIDEIRNTIIEETWDKYLRKEPDDGDISKMSNTQLKRLIREFKSERNKRYGLCIVERAKEPEVDVIRYKEMKEELKSRKMED